MRSIVLLHFEDALAIVRVQGQDHEGVRLGEAWALPCDLVRCGHDLCLAVVENDMRLVCIVVFDRVHLEQNFAGRSPWEVMSQLVLAALCSLLRALLEHLVLKALLAQADEAEVNKVPIIIGVQCARLESVRTVLNELLLLMLDH